VDRRRRRWGGLGPFLIKVEAEEEARVAVAPSAPAALAAEGSAGELMGRTDTVSIPVSYDLNLLTFLP
jgi:hypothetical protein